MQRNNSAAQNGDQASNVTVADVEVGEQPDLDSTQEIEMNQVADAEASHKNRKIDTDSSAEESAVDLLDLNLTVETREGENDDDEI